MYRAESKTLLLITPRTASRHTQGSFAPTPKSTPLRSPVYALRNCHEINYADCAGWFFEIKEENAAVPGYGEAF